MLSAPASPYSWIAAPGLRSARIHTTRDASPGASASDRPSTNPALVYELDRLTPRFYAEMDIQAGNARIATGPAIT